MDQTEEKTEIKSKLGNRWISGDAEWVSCGGRRVYEVFTQWSPNHQIKNSEGRTVRKRVGEVNEKIFVKRNSQWSSRVSIECSRKNVPGKGENNFPREWQQRREKRRVEEKIDVMKWKRGEKIGLLSVIWRQWPSKLKSFGLRGPQEHL
ncbi:unnamed protein product, partial [Allacma fusca]